MIDVQKEFIDAIEEVNREWGARVKAEQDLATEFAGKLTAARSIPETAGIWQEWMSRRMELFAEDSRRCRRRYPEVHDGDRTHAIQWPDRRQQLTAHQADSAASAARCFWRGRNG
jgi:hypothetical protein